MEVHLNETPILLILGFVFLIGLAADLIGRHTIIPRVTLLIVSGLAIGPAGFDLLPPEFIHDWFPPLTYIALSMIGFLLGHKLSIAELKGRGRLVLGITIGETLGALLVVYVALMLLGVDPVVSLLLAGIATATAPAATFDVVRESGASGKFADTLLSVVAMDDAWALLFFSLIMAVASIGSGNGTVAANIAVGLVEIGGSVLLGAVLGIPMAYLTGRIRKGEPTLAEAIGFVLLCGGLAIRLDLSPILSAMAMGSVVASLASHHDRPFHAIEGIEWPFMILFFVLAGASAHIDALLMVSGLVLAYMLFRCTGSYLGARIGARLAGADPVMQRWIGLCLFPQAGVALGMALMGSQRFPAIASILLPAVLASTIVFELIAPVITRHALRAAGAVPAEQSA